MHTNPAHIVGERRATRRSQSSARAAGRCVGAAIRAHGPQAVAAARPSGHTCHRPVRRREFGPRGSRDAAEVNRRPQPTHSCFRRAQICVLTHRKSADSAYRKVLWAHRVSRLVDLCVLMARAVAACQTRAPVPVACAVTACRPGAPPPHAGSHGGTPKRRTSQPRASWPSRRWRQSRLPGWRPRAAPWARPRWRPRWSTPCPRAWAPRRA